MRHTLSAYLLEPVLLADCSIVSAGLNAIPGLEGVAGSGPWTLLAPTDTAFASLTSAAMDQVLASRLPLTELLRTHLVHGIVTARRLPGEGWLRTARGDRLPVDVFGDVVLIDGARVVRADVALIFGIAHVIDRVLLSDRSRCAPD